MIRSGLARTTINARVNRIRRVFKWGVRKKLLPAPVHLELMSLEGLQPGRSGAREPAGLTPAPPEHVEAVLPLLPRPVAAMVRIQLLCGCRAGEVTAMRGPDLTPGTPTWEYRPASHKNAWRGRSRVIPLGPKAQAIVREFLKPDPEAYLFDPRDAVEELHGRRAAGRRSRPTPSERSRRAAAPGVGHASRYDRRTYRQAIVRACRRAGVPAWCPLQLRHAAATAIRARYGLDGAQAVLGHERADVTELYAARSLDRARSIMAEVG